MKLNDTSLVLDLNWHVHQNEEEEKERDKNSYKLFYVYLIHTSSCQFSLMKHLYFVMPLYIVIPEINVS